MHRKAPERRSTCSSNKRRQRGEVRARAAELSNGLRVRDTSRLSLPNSVAPDAAQITRWRRCRRFEDAQSARAPPCQHAPGRRRHPPRIGHGLTLPGSVRRDRVAVAAAGRRAAAGPVADRSSTTPSQVVGADGQRYISSARITSIMAIADSTRTRVSSGACWSMAWMCQSKSSCRVSWGTARASLSISLTRATASSRSAVSSERSRGRIARTASSSAWCLARGWSSCSRPTPGRGRTPRSGCPARGRCWRARPRLGAPARCHG